MQRRDFFESITITILTLPFAQLCLHPVACGAVDSGEALDGGRAVPLTDASTALIRDWETRACACNTVTRVTKRLITPSACWCAKPTNPNEHI